MPHEVDLSYLIVYQISVVVSDFEPLGASAYNISSLQYSWFFWDFFAYLSWALLQCRFYLVGYFPSFWRAQDFSRAKWFPNIFGTIVVSGKCSDFWGWLNSSQFFFPLTPWDVINVALEARVTTQSHPSITPCHPVIQSHQTPNSAPLYPLLMFCLFYSYRG